MKKFLQRLLWIIRFMLCLIFCSFVLPTLILFGIIYWFFTGNNSTEYILELGPKIGEFFHLFD